MKDRINQTPEAPLLESLSKIGVVSECECCDCPIYNDEEWLMLTGGDFHKDCVNEDPECGDLHIQLSCEHCGETFYADETGWGIAGDHYYCTECINGFPVAPLESDRDEDSIRWDMQRFHELLGYLVGHGYRGEDFPRHCPASIDKTFRYAAKQFEWYWSATGRSQAETEAFLTGMDMLEHAVRRALRKADKELKEVRDGNRANKRAM